MPRHSLSSSSRTLAPPLGSGSKRGVHDDPSIWSRMDRAQVLGTPAEGHRGCVNALSWSDDGSTLLSGSDDRRICIWGSDPSASTSLSPHPFKLLDTIATGHRANIFSAKYLPNTSTPTIVSCAGDRDVRVFEVERLGRTAAGIGMTGRDELYGGDGPGVTVLRCHYDRTKRIATENSPYLFLTVSEDGSVRQHDLRRPHTCRSECPEPLFRAPRGVDLYSLSVSTVTPHIFAVAGRTDCAFVCDRRMTERQTPSWGNRTKTSGQVNCVRRLGLSNEQWESMGVSNRGPFSEDRHITCVKMSPEHAEEVICAFAQHSTSLFSLYDSPISPSMRHRSASASTSSSPKRTPSASPKAPGTTQYTAADFERSPSLLGKRRPSDRSSVHSTKDKTTRQRATQGGEGDEEEPSGSPAAHSGTSKSVINTGHEPGSEADAEDLARLRPDIDDDDVMNGDHDMHSATEDGVVSGDEVDLDEHSGLTDMEDDDDEEDDEEDEDDMDDMYDIDDFGDLDGDAGFSHPAMDPSEFNGVDKLLPRRSFIGARNMETVKDCNFLGLRSDKVCSGSDDGNFFVWDKDTGRLDGIWEGDGHVVNVMEQHPTLPIVAVSGIDNTVKIFAPLSRPPPNSFSRLHLQESIIKANTDRTRYQPSSAFGNASILEFLASRGIQAHFVGGDEDADGEPQCATQ